MEPSPFQPPNPDYYEVIECKGCKSPSFFKKNKYVVEIIKCNACGYQKPKGGTYEHKGSKDRS